MPTSAKDLNAFDLRVLKLLLNLKINSNYKSELTSWQKKDLCKSYNEKGGVILLHHDHLLKIWPKKNDIAQSVTLITLNQFCGLLKQGYSYSQFVSDASGFRPVEIPNGKPYTDLNKNERDLIDKAIKEIFTTYKDFNVFKSNVIDKIVTTSQTDIEIDGKLKSFINKIYVELITRKAAIPIDEDNDVIEEIYNSWYKLFCNIRDEIKLLPILYLKGQNKAEVVGLTIEILNEVLRPHLTEHQAKFRQWLQIAKLESKFSKLTPQKLQKKYPDYTLLIKGLKETNKKLMQFSDELFLPLSKNNQ